MLGDFNQAGDALRGVEGSVDSFYEGGDFASAYTDGVEGEDGLREFQGGSFSIREDLGMEVAIPYARDFQVLQGTDEGEEVAGVVAVGLGGMILQVDFPSLFHEGFQDFFDYLLDLLFHFF